MQHAKPTMTIFADASVYQDKKVAGWAGYVREDDRKPLWFSGPAKFSPDVTTVELHALAMTVRNAFPYERQENHTHLLLQSDCLYGLEMLWYALKNGWPVGSGDAKMSARKVPTIGAWEQINLMLPHLVGREAVYLKHVKGHQNGVHARSWVNERCDKMAKHEARKQMGKS